ncbi:MAG: hypothetical protein ACYCQJ_15180 [Nitrososphaerales archaeon]
MSFSTDQFAKLSFDSSCRFYEYGLDEDRPYIIVSLYRCPVTFDDRYRLIFDPKVLSELDEFTCDHPDHPDHQDHHVTQTPLPSFSGSDTVDWKTIDEWRQEGPLKASCRFLYHGFTVKDGLLKMKRTMLPEIELGRA